MKRFFILHARMQVLLRTWDQRDTARYARGFTNVVALEDLRRLQAALDAPAMSDDELRATLHANFELLERFADALQRLAAEVDPALGRFVGASAGPDGYFDIGPITLARIPLEGSVPVA
jgi:hypothetical protein